MDVLLTTLANLGGGFTLAAVILLLHRESLRAFREELAKERNMFARALDDIEAHRETDSERHQEVAARLDLILEHTRRQLHQEEHACSTTRPSMP